MANIPETPTFDTGVYQIETTDKVLGGVDGKINLQARQLANRTAYLKQQLEATADAATEAGSKADSALAQMTQIEEAAGSAAASAIEAGQHNDAALAAKALSIQAQHNAEAAAGLAADAATGAAADRVAAGQKAAEAQASATASISAAAQAVGARDSVLGARDEAVAAAEMAAADRMAAEAAKVVAQASAAAAASDAEALEVKLSEFVSVKDFGAKGDGVTDDTAAIEAAHAASAHVFYPPGTYKYNGAGINAPTKFSYIGAGRELTKINLGTNSRFIATSNLFDRIEISGFSFVGGLGAILNSSTISYGGAGLKIIRDNEFLFYTQCAIDSNHGDCPYWQIESNVFKSANSTSTIGIALSRNSDVSIIRGNAFEKNAVHLKLNKCGYIAGIEDNDFIQFDTGVKRIAIWITGDNSNTNYININGNKFGNENLTTTDYRIAVLPELAGATNGARLPDFSTMSMVGTYTMNVTGNIINGADGNGPFIYSVSGELRGTYVGRNMMGGTLPTYMIQYAQATFVDNPFENVLFGENYNENAIALTNQVLSNVGYYGHIEDHRNVFEGDPRNPNSVCSLNTTKAGYTELLSTRIGSLGLANASKVGNIVDSSGETEAAEFSITNGSELYAGWTVTPTRGEVMWIEFELAAGSANPVSEIGVQVYSATNTSPVYWFRKCKVPASGWRPFRFKLSIAGSQASRFRFLGLSSGQVKIGRLRIYHSRSPVALGASSFERLMLTGLPTKKNVPANHVFADEANKNILRLSDGAVEQATSGSLSDKQFLNVSAGASQLVYSLGMTTGYANALFTFEIMGNRNATGQLTKRKIVVSASGTSGTPNSVASVGTPSNTLEFQDNVVWDFTVSVSVVSGKLQLSVTPTTYVGHFQVIGRWQCAYTGNGGKIVTEN